MRVGGVPFPFPHKGYIWGLLFPLACHVTCHPILQRSGSTRRIDRVDLSFWCSYGPKVKVEGELVIIGVLFWLVWLDIDGTGLDW